MMNRTALFLAPLAALALAACEPKAADTSAAAPPVTRDLSTPWAVHEALIIPGSNVLFSAEAEPPETEAEWDAARLGAGQVIDGAAALQAAELAQGRQAWIDWAQMVIDNTKLTAEALADNNADDLVFTNGDMMSGCTGCHQDYRVTPQ